MRHVIPITLMSVIAISSGSWAEEAPSWLERTSLSVTEAEGSDVEFEFETVQPLMQTPETHEHTVFVQGRLAKTQDDETINIGVGYRNLNNDESMLLGVNAFYDATTEYGHRRASVGVEAIGKTMTARANIYSALTNEKKKVKGSVTTYQTALDGYDLAIDAPVPYMPWMRVQATSYKFSSLKGFDDVSGSKVAVIGNLNQNISFELGADDNNYNGTDGFVSLQYNLAGVPTNGVTATLEDGAFSQQVTTGRDLKNHTLDKVVRNNNIIVQTRGGIVIGRAD